ncbi:MAG: hypothetical protein ACHQAX_01175 [Gammaproteobacteria bacterium]
MSKTIKRLLKLKQNPTDWRIEDLKSIADSFGIDYRQPGTSHVTFRTPAGKKLTVPARKPIKPIYIKQFVMLIEEMMEDGND